MILTLIFAASLGATFVAWYASIIVPANTPRGVLRATIIAFLCSPGILIGHGVGVAPSLFALYFQPSIFTVASILIVWVIALGVIFGVPALRNDRSEWPPSFEDIFFRAHPVKFVFFGVVAATCMQAFIVGDQWPESLLLVLKYGLFFAGAVTNLALCYRTARSKRSGPWVTPAYFALPAVLVAAPTVALMWYGGGAIGGLVGAGRRRSACWLSLGVFTLLSANSAYRVYAAAVAPDHVTIGGGVAGNAVMAAVFLILGVAPCAMLKRRNRAKASAMTHDGT
ncbi:MAG: hypothetical protein KJP08_03585 [Gammaproteobacteria bacterium]|nr:hypothetical protein [Gammaproteobacteria bacterium]NNF49475.1 hypothetical protein [Woeseiaceae bacterium]MBT8093869.1 hypothetical protein [Gammaproteobacteria bacterium]MBT8105940.1 hypothetical protein [Gammaproteobacteria bacterium]NNK25954.1 hypothetical protein [Woeseiaceae bacterium]